MKNIICTAIIMIATSSQASTVDFYASYPSSGSLHGKTINGFTFMGDWEYHAASISLPFADQYYDDHAIFFIKGSFDLQEISLGGSPWPGFYGYSNPQISNWQKISFFDINGKEIAKRTYTFGTEILNFSENIKGIHSFVFYGKSNGGNSGFWPSLERITYTTSSVPEPLSSWLALFGALVVGFSLRKKT